jgi:hypothetical protein
MAFTLIYRLVPPWTSCTRTSCSCRQTKGEDGKMGWTLGIIYFVLLITLGVLSLRKGHWIMFIVGLFIPLFWLIGALMPRRVA